MNPPQRLVLILGAIAVLAICLFPPWVFLYDYQHGSSSLDFERGSTIYGPVLNEKRQRPAGYHFVFTSHVAQDETALNKLFASDVDLSYVSIRIDKERFAIQLIGILVITGMLCLAFAEQHRVQR